MITVKPRLIDIAMSDLARLYVMSADDRFADLFFDETEGANAVLDRFVVFYVSEWSVEAQRELALALDASLLLKKEQLLVNLTPSGWFLFEDPVDAFYGYVARRLSHHRNRIDLEDAEILWDPMMPSDLSRIFGPLPTHDWSEFY